MFREQLEKKRFFLPETTIKTVSVMDLGIKMLAYVCANISLCTVYFKMSRKVLVITIIALGTYYFYSLVQVTLGVGLPVTEQEIAILLPSFTISPEYI